MTIVMAVPLMACYHDNFSGSVLMDCYYDDFYGYILLNSLLWMRFYRPVTLTVITALSVEACCYDNFIFVGTWTRRVWRQWQHYWQDSLCSQKRVTVVI